MSETIKTINNINVASELEGISIELERITTLISIVSTEIFDKIPEEGKSCVLLGPYEMSFGAVLDAAIKQLMENEKTLYQLSLLFYENAKKEKNCSDDSSCITKGENNE